MKYSAFIPAIVISFLSVNALADTSTCKSISGHINPLSPDPNCTIQQAKTAYFPDTTLVAERIPQNIKQTCFSSTLTGTLTTSNNIQTAIQGTAYSGLTANEADYELTAVSAINLSAARNPLGWVFTKDVIINPYPVDPANPDFTITKEILSVIGGNNSLKNNKGHITILGSVFNPSGANFVGKFCY